MTKVFPNSALVKYWAKQRCGSLIELWAFWFEILCVVATFPHFAIALHLSVEILRKTFSEFISVAPGLLNPSTGSAAKHVVMTEVSSGLKQSIWKRLAIKQQWRMYSLNIMKSAASFFAFLVSVLFHFSPPVSFQKISTKSISFISSAVCLKTTILCMTFCEKLIGWCYKVPLWSSFDKL